MQLGENANYDLSANYTSAHAGLGYIVPLNDANSLDLSAKYLWTTTGDNDVIVAGDPIHFDRIDSSRIRLNIQLKHQYSNTLNLQAGLGYEHEFDGEAKATTYSIYRIDAPDMKGGTGILTLGAALKPSNNRGFSLDAQARGYMGKREGVGLELRADYAF